MKKEFSLMLMAVCLTIYTQAQVFVGLGAGASTAPSASADLYLGYNIRGFLFQGGYVTHINRKDPAIFNARLGHEFYLNDGLSVSLTAGYAYQLFSTDNNLRNMTTYIIAADVRRHIRENEAIVFTIYNSDKYLLASIGFRHFFINK